MLQEYGRLIKSIFVLRYLQDTNYRRKIGKQLNKGEKLHALKVFLCFGGDGKIRKKQYAQQVIMLNALTLLTNMVISWNTRYMQKVIDGIKATGASVNTEDIKHLSPARTAHINRYGKYSFDLSLLDSDLHMRDLR